MQLKYPSAQRIELKVYFYKYDREWNYTNQWESVTVMLLYQSKLLPQSLYEGRKQLLNPHPPFISLLPQYLTHTQPCHTDL